MGANIGLQNGHIYGYRPFSKMIIDTMLINMLSKVSRNQNDPKAAKMMNFQRSGMSSREYDTALIFPLKSPTAPLLYKKLLV